jgi:hypothetical protein
MSLGERGIPARVKLQLDREQRPLRLGGELRQPSGQQLERRLDIGAVRMVHQIAQKRHLILDMRLHDLDQQVVLAGEIGIERALRVSRRAANAADRDPGHAFLDDRGIGGSPQTIACLQLCFLARDPHVSVLSRIERGAEAAPLLRADEAIQMSHDMRKSVRVQ